jgi:sugar/nucleoside kinase (ribokinase family)
MLDLIAVGPLVELHVVEVAAFPTPGGVSQARYEPIAIGCDAPIVAARVARLEHRVRLLGNPIGGLGHTGLRRWLEHHRVAGPEESRAAGPCRVIGVAVAETRQRTWLPPHEIGAPDLALLTGLASRHLYVDWYPEVRPWFPGGALERAARGRALWINLAAQLDEAWWPACDGVAPELVQISARMSHDDATGLARRIATRMRARNIVVTLGPHGSILAQADRDELSVIRLPGEGASRTAAGAMFIGSLLGARLAGATWRDAHLRASDDAAAFVAGGDLGVAMELAG